jgi:predicted acylesterase/phospholipase RssA
MGLFAARFLELLEHSGPPIGTKFDLIAGTSVGGLIALGLASGKRASEIRSTIESNGPAIFEGGGSFLQQIRRLFEAPFGSTPLEKTIRSMVGDTSLSQLLRPVLVPAVDLASGRPQIFRSHTAGQPSADAQVSVVDVALATTAAPTYFAPHSIAAVPYADGGLVANAPDALAAVEALMRNRWHQSDVQMLSIGTTNKVFGLPAGVQRAWGIATWLRRGRLLELAMTGQMELSRAMAMDLLGAERVTIVDPALSEEQAKKVGLGIASQAATATLLAIAQSEFNRISRVNGLLVEQLRA